MRKLTTSTKVLFSFTFLSTFVSVFYEAWQLPLPVAIIILTPIVFAWLFWLWLKEDSRRSGAHWPSIDLGLFVYIAWFAILPYHLFSTRGLKAMIGITAFIGVYLSGWLAAILVILLIWQP